MAAALEGLVEKLKAGIEVADVSCGHGHSTLLMARAFPKSRFHGYDVHAPSIEEAHGMAEADGLEGNARFEAARATDYPDRKYGLICFFDCLHDMGDPVAAAQYAAKVLAPDGTVLLVEPFANDRTEDNISPVARLYYTGSTMLCCPHAVSEGGHIWCWRQGGRRGGRGHEPHALHDVVREAARDTKSLLPPAYIWHPLQTHPCLGVRAARRRFRGPVQVPRTL
ncbi:class I SAM-dependent methyltransferase [Verrucomicrobium spinosum]|uniref:class I SAM-dependent methyltransferase n=1 Tax=Verrucomicrobium spinosum TaxID=2736 RepID=UPI0001745AAE|nr:class I SAM-dependent methyltransferase [Verrucomicrobium spinosum]